MNWFLILLILVLVGTGAGGWMFIVWQKINHSIAISKPLIANTQSYEQHPANPNVRILVAGDSIGVGVGAANNTDSLAGRMGKSFPEADITNIAVSGAKLADLEKELGSHTEKGYDIIFISIGGNDITGRTKFNDIHSSLTRTLAHATGMGKKVITITAGNVGVCPAFKWPLSAFITYRTREVRKIFIDEVAKYPSAAYVDLFKERTDEIFNTDIPRYYAPDLFHPSSEGYSVWFEKLRPLL